MTRTEKLEKQAGNLTTSMPPGTRVNFWPGPKTDPARAGVIRASFSVLGTHTIVGWIDTARGCVAASHIEKAQ